MGDKYPPLELSAKELRGEIRNVKLLAKIGVIFDRFNGFLAWLAAIILILGWLLESYEIFMRYFLNRPTLWTMDIVLNTLVWATFLGTAWLLRREGHVKIEMLVLWLKPRVQFILNSITSILCAFGCFFVAWFGALVVWEQFQKGLLDDTALSLPQAPQFSIIPIGFFLLSIQFLRRSYGYMAGWRLPQAENKGGKAKP